MLSPPERRIRLEVDDVTVVVDLDEGARGVEWTVTGHQLLGHYGDDAIEHGMYPMAPWAGRIRDNSVEWNGHSHALPVTHEPWAIHGTALAQPASVLELTQDRQEARLVARIGEHPGWPWPMAIDVEWHLRPRQLTTSITVHALDEPFPAVVGWHPWFRRQLDVGAPLELSMRASERLVRGADHLPTSEVVPYAAEDGPFDDAFRVPDGRATVSWPGVLAIDIASDSDWYVVFDELASYVCVEPQSGPPDGLRAGDGSRGNWGGPAIASPGDPRVLTTTWTLRDLSR
jgi:galactose mutarotase-like enzyme